MTKQLHTARAAAMGYEAAGLAVRGLTGPRFILEGPQGFFAGLCPDGDPALVVDDPGRAWAIHETSFKPWPACRHCHPAIDAALDLRASLDSTRIASILVETYGDAVTFCDRATPTSVIEAKFSLQHAVAVALLDGPPPLAAFDPPVFARPDVAALRARTRVAATDAFSNRYPAHFGAALTVTLDDGATLRAAVPDALGDPENPLAVDATIAKARTLMAHAGLDAARIEAVVAATLALARGAPVAALARCLTDEDGP
jgi:2-methylcitrate dehydratase PrpD